MTVFLDANPLVYAQGKDTKTEMCRQIILQGGVIGSRAPDEFMSVRRHKFKDGISAVLPVDLSG